MKIITKKILFFIILLVSASTFAQNLLLNGSFDTDTSNWNMIQGGTVELSWASNDGHNQNGSIELKDSFNNGGTGSIQSDAITIVAGQKYKLSGYGKVVASSLAQDAGFFIIFFRADNTITLSTEVKLIFNEEHDTWHFVETSGTAPADATYARVALGVTTPNSNSTDDSIARWDDLRFELDIDDPNSFAITPGHSALWYDPNQNGHGINVYVLENQRILVVWYVYDQQGNPLWLLGVGTHDGVKATMDVTISTGAMFPPNFDSNDVNTVDWGKFELAFSDCTNGVFKWIPDAGNGFSAGEMNIKRATKTFGVSCSE